MVGCTALAGEHEGVVELSRYVEGLTYEVMMKQGAQIEGQTRRRVVAALQSGRQPYLVRVSSSDGAVYSDFKPQDTDNETIDVTQLVPGEGWRSVGEVKREADPVRTLTTVEGEVTRVAQDIRTKTKQRLESRKREAILA